MEQVLKFVEEYEMQKDGYEEIYIPIRDYDNYEISNFGNVRKKNTGLILKYSYDRDEIRYVTLNKNGIKTKYAVWLLELLAFGDF